VWGGAGLNALAIRRSAIFAARSNLMIRWQANMGLMEGSFKLESRGTDGFDLILTPLTGFGAVEGKRSVTSLQGAIEVMQKVIGRPLTAGETQTLAIGNGVVASFNSENFNTYF
jgi:hypothetical protein